MAIISNATTIADAGAFSVSLGSLVHIKTLTASSSATLSFVHGTDGVVLDSTYPIYKFEFINIHPSGGGSEFMVGFRDGGTDYDATKTTTVFYTYHMEDDSATTLTYNSSEDLAQSTADQRISFDLSNLADASLSGTMFLFNPSSTTFVKHFISNVQHMQGDPASTNVYVAGYGNTTSAINAIIFRMNTGNIDAGTIKMYGIKGS